MNELERKINQLPPPVRSIIRGEFLPALQGLRRSVQEGNKMNSERYKESAKKAYTRAFIEQTMIVVRPGNVEAAKNICQESMLSLNRFQQLELAVTLGYEGNANTKMAALTILDGQPQYHIDFLLSIYAPS